MNMARPQRQRGQALVEMAVLAAVLVPLFLLIPTLGKYIHTKQVTQQAARSAAWDATVVRDYNWNNLNSTQQRRLLMDRHFAAADQQIQTNFSGAAESARLGDPMLNSFSDRPLVERKGIRALPYRNTNAPGITGTLGRLGILEKLPGEFPPNQKGMVTAELAVKPEHLRTDDGAAATFLEPFDTLDLEFRGKTVVLADAWNAAGNGVTGTSKNNKRSVHAQTRSLVLTSSLDGASKVLEKLEPLEMLPVLGVITRLRPGYIQPDFVPNDKLERYRPR